MSLMRLLTTAALAVAIIFPSRMACAQTGGPSATGTAVTASSADATAGAPGAQNAGMERRTK